MTPTAHVEMIVAHVRVLDGGEYGDPYGWCCTVRALDEVTVLVSGVDRCPTLSQLRAMRDAMRELGYRRAVWERRKNGATKNRKYGP